MKLFFRRDKVNCRPLFLRPFMGRNRRLEHLSKMLETIFVQRRLDANHPLAVRGRLGRFHQATHRQHRRLRGKQFFRR